MLSNTNNIRVRRKMPQRRLRFSTLGRYLHRVGSSDPENPSTQTSAYSVGGGDSGCGMQPPHPRGEHIRHPPKPGHWIQNCPSLATLPGQGTLRTVHSRSPGVVIYVVDPQPLAFLKLLRTGKLGLVSLTIPVPRLRRPWYWPGGSLWKSSRSRVVNPRSAFWLSVHCFFNMHETRFPLPTVQVLIVSPLYADDI